MPIRVERAPDTKESPEFTAYRQRIETATTHAWPRLFPQVQQLIGDSGGVSVIVAPTRRECFNGFESLEDLYRGHEWPENGEAVKRLQILDKRRVMSGPMGYVMPLFFKLSMKIGQAQLWLAKRLRSSDIEQHQADVDHQSAWLAFMTAKPQEEERAWSRLMLMRFRVDPFRAIQPQGTPYIFTHPEDPHQWGDGQAITDDNDVPDRMVVHEVGHRFDYLGKKVTPDRREFSKQPGFRQAVWQDVLETQRLMSTPATEANPLWREVRQYASSVMPSHPEDDAGMLEAFAEGTAWLQGESSLWTGNQRIPSQLFRRTHHYLQNKVLRNG